MFNLCYFMIILLVNGHKNKLSRTNIIQKPIYKKELCRQFSTRSKYIIKKKIFPHISKQYHDMTNDKDIQVDSLVRISDITVNEFLELTSHVIKINKEFIYLTIIIINEYIIKHIITRDKKLINISNDILIKILKNMLIQIVIHYTLKYIYFLIHF